MDNSVMMSSCTVEQQCSSSAPKFVLSHRTRLGFFPCHDCVEVLMEIKGEEIKAQLEDPVALLRGRNQHKVRGSQAGIRDRLLSLLWTLAASQYILPHLPPFVCTDLKTLYSQSRGNTVERYLGNLPVTNQC